MITLAVALQKGGVGKTTTCAALGVELSALGQRVLLVDLDSQSNLTMALGIDVLSLDASVYDLLLEPKLDARRVIAPTRYGPDVLPATPELANADLTLVNRFGREQLLKKVLAQVAGAYDVILLDCPPSLATITVNALVAADAIIVPLQTHAFALRAMKQLEAAIEIAQTVNPTIHIGGIVLTMTQRTSASHAVEQQAEQLYPGLIFQARIPQATKLIESSIVSQPIGVYAPGSPAAHAYRALAQEVYDRYGTT